MRDLKFLEAGKIVKPAFPVLRTMTAIAALDSFNANARRAINLLCVPGWSFVAYERLSAAYSNAIPYLFGDQPAAEKVEANKEAIAAAADRILSGSTATDQEMRENMAKSTRAVVRVMNATQDQGFHEVIAGLLENVVIELWTSVEVLATDLHAETLSRHPACFSAAALTAKYDFRRLSSLIGSYEKAFDNELSIVSAVVNPDLKALALLRHLLVHCRGIVDEKHIKQRIEPPTVNDFDAFGEDDKVFVDGEMVRRLAEGAIIRTYDLVRAVDQWIACRTP